MDLGGLYRMAFKFVWIIEREKLTDFKFYSNQITIKEKVNGV